MTKPENDSGRTHLIQVANGSRPADLVLKNGRVVNVFTGSVERLDVAIQGQAIAGLGGYQAQEVIDLAGAFLAPGLVEPHLHLESTMLDPAETARLAALHGTTAIVADPHEIANVLGLAGIGYMLAATEHAPAQVFFMAPSCVPATHLETSGAALEAGDLAPLAANPRVLGLAEMMNFPGLIHADEAVLAKMRLFERLHVDGHAPLVRGRELAAYLAGGADTDHETSQLEEAGEKLARGMRLFIREGSTARNMETLLPVITPANLRRLSFCTDDLHAEDLLIQGHLDRILRRAVGLGLDPVTALTMCTLNPAEAHGLVRRGAVAPGWRADLVVFEDLENFEVRLVISGGRVVARHGEIEPEFEHAATQTLAQTMNVADFSLKRLATPVCGPRARAITVVPGQVLTGQEVVETPQRDGFLAADPRRDLCLLMVIERHKGTGNIGRGLIKGFGLEKGALACSVAHDSHNIVAVGCTLEEIHLAVSRVIELGGGAALAEGEKIVAELGLPLAGLMSPLPAARVARRAGRLRDQARRMGGRPEDPLMCLSFLALPVIPELKLTDLGLVDVGRFELTSLFVAG